MKMRIIVCISDATILGWLLYFSIALSTVSESLSATGLVSLNSGIFRFLTAPEKKRFKNSAFFSSCLVTVSSSTKVIFSFDLVLSENNGFTVLQNYLIKVRCLTHIDIMLP